MPDDKITDNLFVLIAEFMNTTVSLMPTTVVKGNNYSVLIRSGPITVSVLKTSSTSS